MTRNTLRPTTVVAGVGLGLIALTACQPMVPGVTPGDSAVGEPTSTRAPVQATPGSTPLSTPAPSHSTGPTRSVTPAVPAATVPGVPVPTPVPGVTLTAVDGGPDYFKAFPKSLPSGSDFFPVGVWFESVIDQGNIDKDVAAGINTYVALTKDSNLDLVKTAGLNVIPQAEEWTDRSGAAGSEVIKGWLIGDELDMIEGPVKGPRTLAGVVSGLPKGDGRLRYNNYGKGVTFWHTDAEAARFVNEFQDVVSADNYWFTDPNICGAHEGGALLHAYQERELTTAECRRASNYGATVDRVRELVEPRAGKPVWNFVELGQPFSDNGTGYIEPAQVRAAVWSGIIHGARGVVYFNHSFGGDAQTQHILREPYYQPIRTTVTAVNKQLAQLATVLAAPTATGLVSTGGQVDTLAKVHDGAIHVFAGSRGTGSQTPAFTIPCLKGGGQLTAEVLGENRTVPVKDGAFSDTFADGNAVHIYRIPGTCGLA